MTPQEFVVTTIPIVCSSLVHTNRTRENAIVAWYARTPEDQNTAVSARDASNDPPLESDPFVRSRYEDWMCDFMMCIMEKTDARLPLLLLLPLRVSQELDIYLVFRCCVRLLFRCAMCYYVVQGSLCISRHCLYECNDRMQSYLIVR